MDNKKEIAIKLKNNLKKCRDDYYMAKKRVKKHYEDYGVDDMEDVSYLHLTDELYNRAERNFYDYLNKIREQKNKFKEQNE